MGTPQTGGQIRESGVARRSLSSAAPLYLENLAQAYTMRVEYPSQVVHQSIYSGHTEVVNRGGALWTGELSIPPLENGVKGIQEVGSAPPGFLAAGSNQEIIANLEAMLVAMEGQSNYFEIRPWEMGKQWPAWPAEVIDAVRDGTIDASMLRLRPAQLRGLVVLFIDGPSLTAAIDQTDAARAAALQTALLTAWANLTAQPGRLIFIRERLYQVSARYTSLTDAQAAQFLALHPEPSVYFWETDDQGLYTPWLPDPTGGWWVTADAAEPNGSRFFVHLTEPAAPRVEVTPEWWGPLNIEWRERIAPL